MRARQSSARALPCLQPRQIKRARLICCAQRSANLGEYQSAAQHISAAVDGAHLQSSGHTHPYTHNDDDDDDDDHHHHNNNNNNNKRTHAT